MTPAETTPAKDASDSLLQALADASPDALLALAPDAPGGALRVVAANAAARDRLGARPGLAIDALLPRAGEALAAVLRDGEPRAVEADAPAGPVRLAASRAAGALVLRAEPDGQQQGLEQELKTTRERLDLVVRAARDGIWDWDLATGTLWFSPQWKAHFGYEDHELPNTLEAWEGLIFPEDRVTALRMVDDYLSGQVPAFEAIQRFRHRLGGTVLIYTRAIKVLDGAGRPVRLLGAHTDITHIKQAEARLHNAETRLVDAIERLHDGFVLYDRDDRVVLYNSRFLEYYPELADVLCPGITFEQVLRLAVQRGSIKVAPEQVDDWIAERVRNHQNPGPAFERRLATGRIIRVTEQRTHEGGIVSLGVDVTELRESEERFRSLVSTVPGMVYQWAERADGTRGYTYVSPRCRDIYGVEPEELQRDWSLLSLHPEDVERWQKSIDEAKATLSDWSFEGRFILPDGRPRWWRGVSRPVRVGPGEVRFNGIVIDIEEQKQAEAELKYREAMLRYTAGIAGLGYWVWDRETLRTSYCSPELAAIRGVTVQQYLETLGSFEQQLAAVHPEDRGEYESIAVASAKAKRPYGLEYRIIRPDGQVRHIREVGGPVFGERGRLLKYIGALQDITERRQRELELEEARDRLERQAATMTALARDLEAARDAAEAASRAKSRFLAVMSHELRTPMTGVIGMVDLLLGTPLSTEQRQFLDTLRSSADSLLMVLNDILDFSKIEAGQLALERIPLRLPALLGDVARLFAPAAAAKRLSLDLDLPADPLPDLLGDPTRLRQVLMNLVGNAVKFTEAGGIRLGVALAGDGREGRALRLSVRDTGIGIPPGSLPGLFEPFTQADASTTRRFGGTGLGLAICKRLVGAMGGEIGVESEVGRGSTFWFTLRLPLAPGAGAAAAAPPAAPPRAAPVRVLVAEDNQVNRLLVLAMLQRKGFLVEAVTNGQEAVEAARRDAFDVVLMDMQMPVLDGDGAAAAIRALPAPLSGLPIVALTAEVLPEEQVRRQGGGLFDAYLTKPIDWPRLLDTINALATRRRAERGG